MHLMHPAMRERAVLPAHPEHPMWSLTMNTRPRMLLLACLLLPLTACRDENEPDGPAEAVVGMRRDAAVSADRQAATLPADRTAAAASISAADRSALGVLNAINDHEIALGKQALEKHVGDAVAKHAQRMIDEHGRNRTQTDALNPNPDSADARAQAAAGRKILDQLSEKSGDAYRQAYVQAMVAGHTDALSTLDQRLLPAATNPQVQAHLQRTRERIAQHLEQTLALQDADDQEPEPPRKP